MIPTFFPTAAAFRKWLAKHGAGTTELWIGFYKKNSGLKGMTYDEAVDEALCHGWIDGIRKRVDDLSYMNRFTPRKPKSGWSAVNIAKVKKLEREGRMTPAGRAAFAGHEDRKAVSPRELPHRDLSPAQRRMLKANRRAWSYWQAQPPSYHKGVAYWIEGAKKEETRARRLTQLITCCAEGRKIPPFIVSKE